MKVISNEYRKLAGWPDYEINRAGCVRKVSTGTILRPRGGQVRLAHDRTHRTWRKVDALVLETFKKMYIVPMVSSLSEPGEIWRHVIFAHDYMISSHKRVWSWKTCRFVGSTGANGIPCVLFSDRRMSVDKIHAMHFGYEIPTMEGEEWKRLAEYPGIAVSNMGRVWSDWFLAILPGCPGGKGGYLTVSYRKKSIRVHRLVALAFVPGRDLFRNSVDHINEDKTDNRASNLRWCTDEENVHFYLDNHPIGGSES